MKDQNNNEDKKFSGDSAAKTTGTTPGGKGSENTANPSATKASGTDHSSGQGKSESAEFADKHSSDHEIKEIQGTDRAVTEESQEGILRGTASPSEDQKVGGAQTGLEEGETWENDKGTKAVNQPNTTSYNKETSGSIQGQHQDGISSHESGESPMNPKKQ